MLMQEIKDGIMGRTATQCPSLPYQQGTDTPLDSDWTCISLEASRQRTVTAVAALHSRTPDRYKKNSMVQCIDPCHAMLNMGPAID